MAIDFQLVHDVEQFLYREARLLDSNQFHEWVGLFTDDTRYFVPIRETRPTARDGFYPDDEIAVCHVDDDKAALELRVKRIDTGLAHAESPASRLRHMVSNVEVLEQSGDELVVVSNFLLFQGRRDNAEFFFSGQKRDRLRLVNGEWKIARRKVLLDHTVLPRTVSVFL